MTIVTHFIYPPIPTREFDWEAVTDQYDGGDPIGFGKTEEEAIADLMTQLADDDSDRVAYELEGATGY